MMRHRFAAPPLLVGMLLMLGISDATSHTLSESVSLWQIRGAHIRLQFIVPDLEAKRLSSTGIEVPSSEVIGGYIFAHVGASAAGQSCAILSTPRNLSATPGFSRYELEFACPADHDIRIRSTAFYDKVPSHTDFARIEDGAGNFSEELLTNDRREVAIAHAGARSPLQSAGFLKFIQMGMMHIFTGVDHMSFMLGLVLISRRVRDLLFVVTGFTIGHSLTLALAVTGVLRPDVRYIDALVALTIALIGAENIGDSTRHPMPVALGLGGLLLVMGAAKFAGAGIGLPMSLLIGGSIFSACYLLLTGGMRDAGKVRLLVTLVFGLIHGFGFASSLLEMRLPAHRIVPLLVGFNVGVEIGQIAVVLGAVMLARLSARLRLSMPRPLFTDLAASFLVGEGLFWFLSRSAALG